MMIEDPWKSLALPSTADVVNARRIDASIPWHFFWARSSDGKYLLLLRHAPEAAFASALPRLKGVEVAEYTHNADQQAVLSFKLLDPSHRDIFHRLCQDIVDSCNKAGSEAEAVQIALARTWRWHHLLRGGSDGRLSTNEQKGLLGELLVLEKLLMPNLSPRSAVTAWQGPLGAPKDFVIGRVCIEAKACSGAAAPSLTISSEHQLDSSGVNALFLYVSELDRAESKPESGSSVADVATRIRDYIHSTDPATVTDFENLVEAAGLNWDDDYSDVRWIEGRYHIYRVIEGFPRISAAQIPAGITNVRYSLSLLACSSYETSDAEVVHALKGTSDVN